MLIRFTKSMGYARQFQRGSIYMNSLSWFMENGFEKQNDMMEGVICTRKASEMPVEETLQKGMKFNARFQAKGYLYCNVCCFSAVNIQFASVPGITSITAPADMETFGRYAVIIRDTNALVERVIGACRNAGFKVMCGPINYHTPHINENIQTKSAPMIWKSMEYIDLNGIMKDATDRFDSFDKHAKYIDQNEWRISLYRGEKSTEAYTLNVGDLSDITCIVDSREVNTRERIENQIRQLCPAADNLSCYKGNISRRGLREAFYKLGDNQAAIIFGI